MKLNSRGDVLMGAGGVQGSYNRTPFPFGTYGGGAFQDDDTVIVALREAGAALARWHPSSPQPPVIIPPPRGANGVAGGGGTWIALGDQDKRPLLYGSIGDRLLAGFGDVASDGTIAFKTRYWSDAGVTIIAPDGRTETVVPEASGVDIQALPGGTAIWSGGAYGRAAVRPFYANARGVQLATAAGEDWLLYFSDGTGLILHVDGDDEGYVLETQGFSFNATITGGPFLTVAWSQTQAEHPGDLVLLHATRDTLLFVIDPNKARARTTWQTFTPPVVTTPRPTPAPTPVPTPEPKPEPKPMPHMPSLDAWINTELPQLIAAYRANPSNAAAMADDPHAPHAEWGAFQTYRRYVEGWTFQQMLTHEQTQGQPVPPEPP